jgi:hypothetical protein
MIDLARYGSTATGRLGMKQAAQGAAFETAIHRTREEAVAAVLGQAPAGRRPKRSTNPTTGTTP